MTTGQDSCYKKSDFFIQNCHHHFNLRLLMELTCLNSIKSGPILTHPATHSKQMKLFHFIATRFNIYYCLLTLNRSIRLPRVDGSWMLNEMETTRPQKQNKHIRNFAMRRAAVGSAESKHIIDILWLKIHGKTIKRGEGWLLSPRTTEILWREWAPGDGPQVD